MAREFLSTVTQVIWNMNTARGTQNSEGLLRRHDHSTQRTKLEKGYASSRVGSSERRGQFHSELEHGFVPFAVAPHMQNGDDDNF